MARSTALAALAPATLRRAVAPEPRRTLRDLVGQLQDMGPIRFRRRLTAPALVWKAITGPVFDEPGMRRPTKRVRVLSAEELHRVTELAEQVWFLRSRTELGPAVTVLAGRAPHCDVVLNDYSVSQEHCVFELRTWKGPPSRFEVDLRDLSSLNGTSLGGAAVDRELAVRVRPGQALEIGRLALTLLEPDALFARVRALAAALPAEGWG